MLIYSEDHLCKSHHIQYIFLPKDFFYKFQWRPWHFIKVLEAIFAGILGALDVFLTCV